MNFNSINLAGIAVATLAGFVTGALWFSPKTFFPMWWKAMEKPADEVPGKGSGMGEIFVSLVVGLIVQAVVLSGVLNGFYPHASVTQGAYVGAILGVGICAMSSLGHRLFAGHGFLVWALEAGNDIAALAIMGAIIAAF